MDRQKDSDPFLHGLYPCIYGIGPLNPLLQRVNVGKGSVTRRQNLA
jgi:hypothetical protein